MKIAFNNLPQETFLKILQDAEKEQEIELFFLESAVLSKIMLLCDQPENKKENLRFVQAININTRKESAKVVCNCTLVIKPKTDVVLLKKLLNTIYVKAS